MRYTITGRHGDEIVIYRIGTDVAIEVGEGAVILTTEQFKDLRRAIGYIWTEVEAQ